MITLSGHHSNHHLHVWQAFYNRGSYVVQNFCDPFDFAGTGRLSAL
jgi:hypothetical protein